jgi:hypothetical protein
MALNSRARGLGYGVGSLLLALTMVMVGIIVGRERQPAPEAQAAVLGGARGLEERSKVPGQDPDLVDTERTETGPRLAVATDGPVPEPVEAVPQEPPKSRRLGFHRYPPFPSALECAQDPRFNPTGAKLEGDDLARLESIISSWNQYLNELEKKKIGLAESLARGIIDQGLATPVEDGVQIPAVAGSITVTVTYAGGHSPQRVVIQPGDFAELDLIAVEIESVVDAGHSDIQEFFATL